LSKDKQLWLIAGGNGAGKSTFYEKKLKPKGLPFVNADIIAREYFPHAPEENSITAAKIAEQMRYQLLSEGKSFCFETVFSHESKIDFIAAAKALNYVITLVFIHLDSAELNMARVAQRVTLGGHSVPEEKISARIPRTLEHIKNTIPLCDHVRLLDNSRVEIPFQRIANVDNGIVSVCKDPLPMWASRMLGLKTR